MQTFNEPPIESASLYFITKPMRHCQVAGCNVELPDYWVKDACDECFNKVREEYRILYEQSISKRPQIILSDSDIKYTKSRK